MRRIVLVFLVFALLGAAPAKGPKQVPEDPKMAKQNQALDSLSARNVLFDAENWIDVVKRGDIDNVRSFLQAGMHPETRYEDSPPPVMIAAVKGYAEVIGALADAGADLRIRNSAGWTPLQIATLTGKNDTVKVLVEKGAEVNTANAQGYTPLMIATEERNLELIEFLLANGADVGARAEDGLMVLDIAVGNNQGEVLSIFEKRGYRKTIKAIRERNAAEAKAKKLAEKKRKAAKAAAAPTVPK